MPAPVHLLALALARFRNHPSTRIEPGQAGFVVLVGANGAGKTNLLEAVSLLTVGRGLRGATLSQMAATGGDGGFALQASLLPDPGLPPVVLHSLTRADAPERRLLRVNGANAPLSSLAEWSAQLWLTPAMDGLFTDGSSVRRRFLDRLVLALFPGHAGHASRYQAAMRARTRLLTAESPADPLWLQTLEQEMSVHGAAMVAARHETVEALSAMLAAADAGLFPRAAMALVPAGVSDAADLSAEFRARRGADRAAGRATAGPHRTDLEVTHAGKDMPAALCSTGEQKALLISILLAHGELVARRAGRVPLLLLDEVVAHLDRARREGLFARLAALGGQAWMTGTDPHLFEGLDAAVFHVEGGHAERMQF